MIQTFQRYFSERYMQPFYAALSPNTKALHAFQQRGFGNAFAWASSRMVDDVEGILAQWREERHENRVDLPVCIMAVRRDSMMSPGSFASPIKQPIAVDVDGKTKGVRMAIMDRTVQVAFIGAAFPDTDSLSVQFCLYAAGNRRFYTSQQIDDKEYPFPCVLENSELMPEYVDSGQKNICIHKVNLLFHESIPLVDCDIPLVTEVQHAASPTGTY